MSAQPIHSQSIPPLISFILPVFDVPAELVKACIQSILLLPISSEQREIIVVDDGNAVPVCQLISEFTSSVHIIRQVNAGLSAARNAALDCAQGQYIQFVDADDMLLVKGYTQCLKLLDQQKPDMIMCRFRHHQNEKTFSIKLLGPMTGTQMLLRHNLRASAWSYIFKREILGELRFIPDLFHEDEAFTPLLVLRAHSLYITRIPAYYYRQRPQSIMSDTAATHIDRRLADQMTIIVSLRQEANRLARQEHDALSRRVVQLTMDLIYNTWKLTHSPKRIRRLLLRLRKERLYPLPGKCYTAKYTIFRLLINSISFVAGQ